MEKKKTSIDRVMETSIGLKRTMSTSSAIMVGVGGTIGTGLFLSSGDVISTAGPGGAIVMYLIGGLIIYLMTSCLGELAAAMPVAGSLQAYSTEFISPAMGFTIGWVNWSGGAITITAQIVASAIIMKDILPGILLAVFMGCCIYPVQWLGLPDLVTLLIQVPLGAVIYIGLSALLKLESFTYLWGMVKQILGRFIKK